MLFFRTRATARVRKEEKRRRRSEEKLVRVSVSEFRGARP